MIALFWMSWTYVFGSFALKASRFANPGLETGTDAAWLRGISFPLEMPTLTIVVCYAAMAMAWLGQVALFVRRLRDIEIPVALIAVYFMLALLLRQSFAWPIDLPSVATLICETLLLLMPGARRSGVLR